MQGDKIKESEMTTLRQHEARARQSMIMTLNNNNIRGICKQTGLSDYYRRLQELTTSELASLYTGCGLSYQQQHSRTKSVERYMDSCKEQNKGGG